MLLDPTEVSRLVDVTATIPERRLGAFYQLVGRWLAEEQPEDAVAGTPRGPRNWTDSEEDLALARAVWEKFSPVAKALFSLLMDQPGHKVSGEDLATTLNIPNGKSGVAGVLAWPARYCAAVNRDGPWWWEYAPDGSGAYYWVEPEVAELFNKVRD